MHLGLKILVALISSTLFLLRAGYDPASTPQTKTKNEKQKNESKLGFELPSWFLRLGSCKAGQQEGGNLGLYD